MLHFQLPTARPRCSKCGGGMESASLIPGMSVISSRTFECTRCGHVEHVPARLFKPGDDMLLAARPAIAK